MLRRLGVLPRTGEAPELPGGQAVPLKVLGNPGVPIILPDGSSAGGVEAGSLLMSPTADLGPVAAAGRRVRATYLSLLKNPDTKVGALGFLYASLLTNVGQGGRFDFQRQGGYLSEFKQYRQFREVSNFNVGLFCQQAGLTLEETFAAAGMYARMFSSNASPDNPWGLDPRNKIMTESGYSIGASGMFEAAANKSERPR